MTGGSSNYGQTGLTSEGSDSRNLSFSIGGFDDEYFMINTLEIEPIENAAAVGDSSNANLNEVDSDTIAFQNTSNAYNSDDGWDFS